ncbi:DNA polymerase III subunit epsilon, partial [Streptomyces rubellomurinus subsp. indigoferus]
TWHAAPSRGLQRWFERSGTPDAVNPRWPRRLARCGGARRLEPAHAWEAAV